MERFYESVQVQRQDCLAETRRLHRDIFYLCFYAGGARLQVAVAWLMQDCKPSARSLRWQNRSMHAPELPHLQTPVFVGRALQTLVLWVGA